MVPDSNINSFLYKKIEVSIDLIAIRISFSLVGSLVNVAWLFMLSGLRCRTSSRLRFYQGVILENAPLRKLVGAFLLSKMCGN